MILVILVCNFGRRRSVTAEWIARQALAKRLYGGRGVADCALLSLNLQCLNQWNYLCPPDCDECSVLATLGPYDEIPAAYKEVYVHVTSTVTWPIKSSASLFIAAWTYVQGIMKSYKHAWEVIEFSDVK